MAIKLSGSISRKVPIDGIQFSSQQFGGSLEVEVNSEDPQVIREKLHHLYESLSTAIDAEIAASQSNAPAPAQRPVQQQRPQQVQQNNGNSTPPQNGTNRVYPPRAGRASTNGNGRSHNATGAQVRAIHAITNAQNLDLAGVLADYNVADPAQLHIRDASALIDRLKQNAPRQ